VFIRNPQTLFYFEDERQKSLPRIAVLIQTSARGMICRKRYKAMVSALRIQTIFRGWMCRKKYSKDRAARIIQKYYYKLKSERYIVELNKKFKEVKNDAKLGKNVVWPKAPEHSQAHQKVYKMWQYWRAKTMIKKITPQQKEALQQKFITMEIFSGKKPWDPALKYDADYLSNLNNPNYNMYIENSKNTYSKYGDSQIQFSDYVTKINTKEKTQERGLVVTEKNIYKHDPKNFKIHNKPLALVNITSVSLSKYSDSYVVIHVKRPEKDIVIECDKYAELVTILYETYLGLTSNKLPVSIGDKINYFHGKDLVLTFQKDPNMSPSSPNSPGAKKNTFVKGKREQTILYS